MKISFSVTGSTSTETAPRARSFGRDVVGIRAHEHREHAAGAARRDDSARGERDLRRLVREYDLHAAVTRAQIVERRVEERSAAVDDRDVVRDLLDVGELVRRQQRRHAVARHAPDEQLEKLFGRDGIEARRSARRGSRAPRPR